ncbi:hypothetical protein CFD26_101293 [Aspergillus turcosus]|uniref:Uncharacterized protein n=1 Tax=Aspergillus turcosus TaxID=1245748 RepID=A0A3R7FSF4_9EURO|nr:hypothetical protein CFD26_101293 [Aspergillus turcosus]
MPDSTSKESYSNPQRSKEPSPRTYVSYPRYWVVPIVIIALIWYYIKFVNDREIVVCNGTEVKIPYCLQCPGTCTLECGGPEVTPPYCEPPVKKPGKIEGGGSRLLGSDGRPCVVEMVASDVETAAKEGRKMEWAGTASVNWEGDQGTEVETTGKQLGLCWGKLTGGNMTYACVEIKA